MNDFYTSHPLENAGSLDPLLERIGDARIVMLGEASHGTHEYYTWRNALTQKLITGKGFDFIAVEGDWPDCYRVNRYVKTYEDREKKPEEILRKFNRWPTWMWANWEITALTDWLRKYNMENYKGRKAGFYGLDVYSLWESMEVLLQYLSETDYNTFALAKKAFACFSGLGKDEQQYAIQSLSEPCKDEVIRLLAEVRKRAINYDHDPEATLNTLQNASIAVEAEKYYRNMVSFDEDTWNIRDRHMMDTLDRLLQFHGKNAKAIVWAHNTHIGDAFYTDMRKTGQFNIGQLARETYGREQVVLIGFGSNEGKVLAARQWGAEVQSMRVPEAKSGSWEHYLHRQTAENRLLLFDKNAPEHHFPHRAIGVVYHPENERYNYVPSVINCRYDAFVYVDKTRELHQLHVAADPHQVPESYPFAF